MSAMIAMEAAFLRAVHAALARDATLTGLIGADGVSDRPADGRAGPHVTYGEMTTRDRSTSDAQGFEHFFSIDVWSAGEGRLAAQAIGEAVREALHERTLALDRGRLANLRCQAMRTVRDRRGRGFRLTLTFRAVTEAD